MCRSFGRSPVEVAGAIMGSVAALARPRPVFRRGLRSVVVRLRLNTPLKGTGFVASPPPDVFGELFDVVGEDCQGLLLPTDRDQKRLLIEQLCLVAFRIDEY